MTCKDRLVKVRFHSFIQCVTHVQEYSKTLNQNK